jgi:hypothetical protein
MTQTPTTKCCPRCGVEYPATLEYFPPYKKNLDGLHYWCRVCSRAANRESHKKADPEKKRQWARNYYHNNREKLCERQSKKRSENVEEARKRKREWYWKNRAWLLEKERERRGSKKIDDDDDYSELIPIDERSVGFRSWAVITSSEYAAYFNRKTGLEYPEETEGTR